MNWLRVQNLFWMMLVATVVLPSIDAYSYSLRGEMRSYYLDDIWSEEMFIEPVKDFMYTNEIIKRIPITTICILSVNIDALNPPYKVYASVDNKTIKAVIQSSVPDI